MAEYIEREALLSDVDKAFRLFVEHDDILRLYSDARGSVIYAPAADVAPVVHGRWIDKPTGKYRNWQSWCSACGKHSGIGGIQSNQHKPYCPNCGARMDGE